MAVACFESFGKGQHAAQLNFGDCLSYACAKALGAFLLFKDEDLPRPTSTKNGADCSRRSPVSVDAILWDICAMTTRPLSRPIGPPVNAHQAKRTLEGRWISLAPLDAEKHAEALYEGSNGDAEREAVWAYLFNGPFASLADFAADIELKARSVDPHFSPSSTTPRAAPSASRL